MASPLGMKGDTYGFTAAYSMKEKTTIAGTSWAQSDNASQKDTTYWGLVGYYSPESLPFTLSGGFELSDIEGTNTDKTQWTVGVSSDIGEGTLSATFGTNGAIAENAEEIYAYDLSYEYPINDSMSITPFVYVSETTGSTTDTTGAGAFVSFSF